MQVICHRGYWKTIDEKNSVRAFRRAFQLGLGTETDVRDCHGRLVISHDCAMGGEMLLDDFLDLASEGVSQSHKPTLALNVKSDGLVKYLTESVRRFPMLDCFAFDMSIPDMRSYFGSGIEVFTRMSEVEQPPVWLDRSAGVWLDGFEGDWFGCDTLFSLLRLDKRIVVVSPELHGREFEPLWAIIQEFRGYPNLMLCTDRPEEAMKFFELQSLGEPS
jgi:hypothetical protein